MSAADGRERNLKKNALFVAQDDAPIVALEQLAADAAMAVERSVQPYIGLAYVIALQGIFPSRN